MFSLWFILLILLILLALPTAQAAAIGAPWLPSRLAVVQKLLTVLEINSKDTVVDLGAGTGSVLQAVTKQGAQAVGYELSPPFWLIAKMKLWGNKLAEVHYGNFYRAQLPVETTVIFFFLVPKTIASARHYLQSQNLPQLSAIVSYAFQFPQVAPQKIVQVPQVGTVYVYRPEDLLPPKLTNLDD